MSITNNVPQPQVFEEPVEETDVLPILEPEVQAEPANPEPALRRSQRPRRSAIPGDYMVYLQEVEFNIGDLDDPISYREAMESSQSTLWQAAMEEELASMDKNGRVERLKARLVAKGFTQREGLDYSETFSLVSTKDSFRIIMALTAHFNLELHQMDVKTAFLNGFLKEDIFMKQPPGFIERGKENFFYDILLASSNVQLLQDTKSMLSSSFDMKDLGEAHFVLGIEIVRDRSRRVLGLSQNNYIDRVLKRFNMERCSGGDVPIGKGDTFSTYQCPVTDFEIEAMKDKPYASFVGSVMYAQVCTRPDLAFALSVLGRFQSNPGIAHWNASKKVLRYLQKTKSYVLCYHYVDSLDLVCYSDADLGGCVDDRMSTSGYVFILAGGAVSWRSKKQTTRSVSTMESEYIGCFEAARQCVWLNNLIHSMKIVKRIERPLKLYCDNSSAVFFAKNNKRSNASRLLDIKYLTLQDKVRDGVIDIEHLGTLHMIADPLTKALHVTAFQRLVPKMGLQASIDLF
ncbi:unnamed protein product [Prunus armeniaca]